MNYFHLPLLLCGALVAAAGAGPAPRRLRATPPPVAAAEPPVLAEAAALARVGVAPDGRVLQPAGTKRSARADLTSLLQVSVSADGEFFDDSLLLEDDPPE
mmetsp:Transcript_119719/g.364145  ORF Transcript_119719/g.364145 Transcript_119719/m.364145 type:complete len:101 (+) Transcript_119719:116-418(+)